MFAATLLFPKSKCQSSVAKTIFFEQIKENHFQVKNFDRFFEILKEQKIDDLRCGFNTAGILFLYRFGRHPESWTKSVLINQNVCLCCQGILERGGRMAFPKLCLGTVPKKFGTVPKNLERLPKKPRWKLRRMRFPKYFPRSWLLQFFFNLYKKLVVTNLDY